MTMLKIRRAIAFIGIGIIGIAYFGFLTGPAVGQKGKQPTPTPGSGTAAGNSSVEFIEESEFRRVLNVGRDCIKDQEYKQAVEALQAILKQPKDHHVQVREPDPTNPQKEITRWTSVKFEANNLIGSMPVEGLNVYENA